MRHSMFVMFVIALQLLIFEISEASEDLYPASNKIIKDNKVSFTDPECDFECLDFGTDCGEGTNCEFGAAECPLSCGVCTPCNLETAERIETALGALDAEIDQLRGIMDKLVPGCMTNQDCRNGGKCNNDLKCKCRPGFAGHACQYDVNECKKEPCGANSKCVNLPGSFKCICERGFEYEPDSETTCRKILDCREPSDCLNGGVCNVDGKCDCRSGFRGKKCGRDIDECDEEVDECDPTTGSCRNEIGGYSCECNEGYVKSETNPFDCVNTPKCKTDEDCQNGGSCSSTNVCKCTAAFTGQNCEHDVDECWTGAHKCIAAISRCENEHGHYRCVCKPGYRLVEGSQIACEETPDCVTDADCQNGGTCYDNDCDCTPGFSGKTCQYDVNECLRRIHRCDAASSYCVNTRGSYKCNCKFGYVKNTNNKFACMVRPTCIEDSDCKNGGACDSNGDCECAAGFDGRTCQIDIDECSSGFHKCNLTISSCYNMEGTYACVCKAEYNLAEGSKTLCEKVPNCVDSTDCLNGGACSNGNCTCKSGFKGVKCGEDVNECDDGSEQCDESTSNCHNTFGSYTCECNAGFELVEGTTTTCVKTIHDCSDDGDCNNRGLCTKKNRCLCAKGYIGKHCENDIDECVTGNHFCVSDLSQCKNIEGSYICVCNEGYVLQKGSRTNCTKARDCDETHECENDGICNDKGECDCEVGFSGKKCEQDVDECTLRIANCSSDSVCENTEGSYHCNCDSGYVLQDNSTTECIPEPDCSSHADCLHGGICVNNECNCTEKFTGETCEEDIDECTLNKDGCGSYSMCENTVGGFNCRCNEGYILTEGSETECEKAPACQHDNDCENGGTCNEDGLCNCTDAFSGLKCEKDVDECSRGSDGCHVNSACENTVGGYHCKCDDGYKSVEGSKTECISDLCHNNPCGSNTACKEENGTFTCKCSDQCEMAPEITNDHGQLNCSWFAEPSEWINEGSCDNSCGEDMSMYRERKCVIKKENSAGECETTYFDSSVDRAERGCSAEELTSETVECGICEATDIAFASASNDSIPAGMKVVDIVVEKANGDTCKLSISDEITVIGDAACELDDGFSLGPEDLLVNMALTYTDSEVFKWDTFKFTMNKVTYTATDNSETEFRDGKIQTFSLTTE